MDRRKLYEAIAPFLATCADASPDVARASTDTHTDSSSAEAAPAHSGAVSRAPLSPADASIPNASCEVFFDDQQAWFGGVIVSSHQDGTAPRRFVYN